MSDTYKKELIEDYKNFLLLIGGANEMAERGYKIEYIMDRNYMEEIEEYCYKYIPEELDNMAINKIDDCLHMENKLLEFFESELKEMLKCWD